MVPGISGSSTSAPKMHIAAAPASRNAPGKRTHAEYQGGCTESPRSNSRPAPKTSPAPTTAGSVRPIAQPSCTAPVAAPSRGWTPAAASADGTANASRRSIALAGGSFSSSRGRYGGGLGRQRENRLRMNSTELHVAVVRGLRELGHEPLVEQVRPPDQSLLAGGRPRVRLSRQRRKEIRGIVEVRVAVNGRRRIR